MAALAGMIRGRVPHAILLVGPTGVGKTTLALDLAAGLLCGAPEPADRPCGACRACRLVRSDGHPDVHRLGPEGAGRQVVIGGPGARARGVRDLLSELALLPVEGGARVALIESADRMNEDAQAAILKTLEEPPAGIVLILCADAEEPILPTIRSRCARLRLGPVATRDVEAMLTELGAADAPLAARLARITGGRPGLALAWARDPDALLVRDEVVRTLLDLVHARPAERISGVRAAVAGAARLQPLAGPSTAPAASTAVPTRVTDAAQATAGDTADDPDTGSSIGSARTPATERRRAAEALIAVWVDLARDIALCQRGLAADVREVGLLDETTAAAGRITRNDITSFLERLGRAAVLVRSNVSPDLVVDDLAVHWPGGDVAAA